MADQRSLTAAIVFRTEDAERRLEAVQEAVQDIGEETEEAESAMESFGSRVAASAGAAAGGIQGAAGEAGSFGSAVARSVGESLRSYNSLPRAIKAGIGSGIGYALQKTENFVKRTVTGAGKIGKAFRHPIQTIKDRMAGAVEDAGTEIEGMGDSSEETGEELEGMGRAGEDAGSGIRDALGGVAAKLVALKAGFEIVKAGIETVKGLGASLAEIGMETEAVNARFQAVFDDKEVGVWADSFAEAAHRSKAEVKSFLADNKVLYQELGLTGKEADRLAEVTTSLAYDIGAALKIDDEEALSAVQDYIGGNAAALSQYGMQIDDTVLKQTALSMGYRGSLEELEETELAQIRMNALLENSASIQRQAAEGQTGYANNIKSLKAVIADFGEKAAEKLSPVFDKVTGHLLKAWPKIEGLLLKFMDYLGEGGIGAALPALADMASTALPPFIDALGQVLTAAEPIGGVLLDLASNALPPLLKALGPVVGVIGELAGAVLPPLGKIITKIAETVIPPLVQIIGILHKNVIEPLMPVISKIADAVLPILAAGLEALSPLLELIAPVLEVIGTVLGEVVGFLGKVAEYVAGGIGDAIEKIAGIFGGGNGKAGADIPHNANGTENFAGGMTYINERGGEIAVLPSGSRVIPADKSGRLMERMAGGGTESICLEINVNVNAAGQMDEGMIERLKKEFRPLGEEISEAVYRKMEKRKLERQAMQEGLA